MFGEFIKERRISLGITLRGFCRRIGIDASNWSKTERGLLLPPRDDETLRKIAQVLGIKEGSEAWIEMKDKAHIGAGRIPRDLLSDARIAQALPILFRTARAKRPTSKQLDQLIHILRKE
jgi:transcriptional regulator with XRE-family HTH domain